MSTEKVTFVVGGQSIVVGPLAIWSLERCWDAIQELANPSEDWFKRVRTYCVVLAAAQQLDDIDSEVQRLYRSITFPERQMLGEGIALLLRISGFDGARDDSPQGEIQATAPSAEIGPGSSQNLLPTELKAEAGIG